MTTPSAEPQLRKSTVLEREALKLFDHEKIEVGSTVMAPRVPSGQNCDGGRMIVSTNVHGLFMKPVPIYLYDIAIYGFTRSDRQVELTKKVTGDALLIDRRANCRDVMTAFHEQYPDFVKSSEGNYVYYDLQSLLYSLVLLDVPQGAPRSFPVVMESLNTFFLRIVLEIKEASHGHLTLRDFSGVTENVGHIKKGLEQFLNIATSQQIMFNKEQMITYSSSEGYMLQPEEFGFRPEDSPAFQDNGTYLGIGVRKSVRYVEGPKSGQTNAALVVEVKKTPFHAVQPTMLKAEKFVIDLKNCAEMGVARLTALLRGMRMETTYGRLQTFVVTGVTRDTANQKMIKLGKHEDHPEVSITEYFKNIYGIELQYPDIPLLESHRKYGEAYFPMELCRVSDNQRVRAHQQTPRQIQEMIKKCAIPPSLLRDQTILAKNSLNLSNDEQLKAAQIRFVDDPLNVSARILAPPAMEFAVGNVAQVRTDNFIWMGRQYLIPARVRSWAAFACNAREKISEQEFVKFLGRYVSEARKSGMDMPDPIDVRYPASDPEQLKKDMRLAAENGVEFLLIAHPDTNDDLHAAMKLYERDFSIITQGLRIGTVRGIINKGQTLTLQNILNKTNMKLGGLNYSLVMNNDMAHEVLGSDTLYIGFGLGSPAGPERESADSTKSAASIEPGQYGSVMGSVENEGGGVKRGGGGGGSVYSSPPISLTSQSDVVDKPPAVLGYAANMGAHPFEFLGDILFQESRRDIKLINLRHIIRQCIQTYREKRRKDPRRILIYRNGCSEGQFATVLKFEVPFIKRAIAEIGCAAPLTFVVSNKLQNIRFFKAALDPSARPPDQNIPPGTVMDDCVVHPKYKEFYLNSHRAIQGTARTPRYVVLFDDNNMSMDQLQGITNYLCYGHQIVYSPVSLPAPVYIAMCYAERGLMLYRRIKVDTSSDYDPIKFCELNDRLGYERNPILSCRRINA